MSPIAALSPFARTFHPTSQASPKAVEVAKATLEGSIEGSSIVALADKRVDSRGSIACGGAGRHGALAKAFEEAMEESEGLSTSMDLTHAVVEGSMEVEDAARASVVIPSVKERGLAYARYKKVKTYYADWIMRGSPEMPTAIFLGDAKGYQKWLDVTEDARVFVIKPKHFLGDGSYKHVYAVREIFSEDLYAYYTSDPRNKLAAAEIEILERMVGLRGVMQFDHAFQEYDAAKKPYRTHVVVKYYNAGTLEDCFKAKRALPLEECLSMAQDLLYGLWQIHTQGIIHRDLKPSNILVHMDHGHYKAVIGDFNSAVYVDDESMMHKGAGTWLWAAPEYRKALKALDKSFDFLSLNRYEVDIWGMGLIFYYLFCSEAPMPLELPDPIPLIRKMYRKYDKVPIVIKDLIAAMLRMRPARRRWQSIHHYIDKAFPDLKI